MPQSKQKILVILGPTATLKSDLAVQFALRFNGEIISADSRQVYKGLHIGTGKITAFEMKGVRHHLLDIADPRERFSVTDWKSAAEMAITDISGRGKLPIICGGTGFYIQALLNNEQFPDVVIHTKEQALLEMKCVEELFQELEGMDGVRASDMKNNGDYKNKRRVVRALLIAKQLGRVPPRNIEDRPRYDSLILGTWIPDNELKSRIHARLISRLDAGMLDEAIGLHESPPTGIDLSYDRMNELGLEYRYLSELLQNKLSREQFIEILSTKIWQYARRQKTWFKRDKNIIWFNPLSQSEILEMITKVDTFFRKLP